MRHRK